VNVGEAGLSQVVANCLITYSPFVALEFFIVPEVAPAVPLPVEPVLLVVFWAQTGIASTAAAKAVVIIRVRIVVDPHAQNAHFSKARPAPTIAALRRFEGAARAVPLGWR
jgi:hypothetical protein